jgi:hypothetical protein
MKKTPLLPLTLAGVLGLALAGCTSSDADRVEPSPTPTTTQAAAPDDQCVDGVAFMDLTDGGEKELADGCETVVVIGEGGTLTLGPVTTLSLMGNGTTIEADTVTRVELGGNDNTVTHTGDAPEQVGDGTGNTVTAR